MFCPNCGQKIQVQENFCPHCGHEIPHVKKDSMVFLKNFIQKLRNYIKNHQKQSLVSLGVVLLLLLGFTSYVVLFGFEKISWDPAYEDYTLDTITPTTVLLGIDVSDKALKEIQYDTTCGKVNLQGRLFTWDLTDAKGKCEITVSYKLKKIRKSYQLLVPRVQEKELIMSDEEVLNLNEDSDYDGLTNQQEEQYKTNPHKKDSDQDGLTDYEEIFTYKTDPNKKDTDNDGLNDQSEIELKMDPLKSDTKGDGTKDGDRTFSYHVESNQIKMDVSGKGNLSNLKIEVQDQTKISSKEGFIDKLFTFYTEGELSSANVTIPYTMEELEKYGIQEDDLTLYYYDAEKMEYQVIDTIIDKTHKTLSATLSHFSHYVIGSKKKVTNTESNILFVLDNSWSMYTNEQYKEITGEEYSGGFFSDSILDGSDKDGQRFLLTSDLIDQLSNKKYNIGLSEFRSDYKNIYPIGSKPSTIKSKLKSMNGNFVTSREGTDIGNALNHGIEEFTDEDSYNYLVILSDGLDTSLKYSQERIVEKAIENKVKICSIGFGSGSSNEVLSTISNATGCQFYSSSDATGLTELFENMNVQLKDDLVDVDDDGKSDGLLLADSGFIVNRDGFSFPNYGTNLSTGGHCYGMATFAELYYLKQLPLKFGTKEVENEKIYAYNLTNSYFKDYSPLHNYRLQTNELKYYFGFEYFGEKTPSNLKKLEDDRLTYQEEYKNDIINSDIYDYLKGEKTGLSKEQQLKKYGFTYSSYDEIQLNADKMQENFNVNAEDREMFNAIYMAYMKQKETTHYTSGSDFIIWLRNVIGTESSEYHGAQNFINIVESRLLAKDPLVMSSNYTGEGLHAINAISLVQDLDNPNYYYIGVYDNNYPGEKRYVDVECIENQCLTKKNKYYEGNDEVIRITPNLQTDLNYFQ